MSATSLNNQRQARAGDDGPGDQQGSSVSTAVMRDSMAGSIWTVVSRLVGLGKVITIGAVLGATYLGNTYQAINALPNLVYYQLLAGSLFASLLVPPLVRYLDTGNRRRARRLVGGFLGVLLLVAAVISVVLVAIGPLIMRLLTLGVPDRATAAAQSRLGWLLLVMFLPQIALYVIAGIGAAVMNAHGRFALAAAAPALESLGIIAVLVTAGILFGTGTGIAHLPRSELLLLGLGTTAAVAIHAACQSWGARSTGLALSPELGWRDPEVRRVLRRIVPTLGFTALAALQLLAVMVVANRVSGGLVAFQLALNFFYLPTAIVTWPIARAMLPQLSRLHHTGDDRLFHDELRRAVAVASFVVIPIAFAYVELSTHLAGVLALGQLGRGDGPRLMALSLAALAPGVVGEAWFTLGTYAFYARRDARSPVRSMGIRVGVSLCCMAMAWLVRGPAVLVLLGAAISLGSVVGAGHAGWRLRRRLPVSRQPLLAPLARTVVASLVMVVSVHLAALALDGLPPTKPARLLALSLTALIGAAVFLGVQVALRAPELGWLKESLIPRRVRPRSRT